MKTLGLIEACAVLHMGPEALMRKARAGIVPGSRPGRKWVFVEDHLHAYLTRLVGERACRSIANLRAPTGGSDSRSVESKLDAALERQNARKPRSSRLALDMIYGDRSNSGRKRATR